MVRVRFRARLHLGSGLLSRIAIDPYVGLGRGLLCQYMDRHIFFLK